MGGSLVAAASCDGAGNCAAGVPAPCPSGFCYGTPPACQTNSCSDGVLDGSETDVDCGGTACIAAGNLCAYNKKCFVNADCKSNWCPTFGPYGVCHCTSNADCPPTAPKCGAQMPGICGT
jgi:hypothetical protein